MRQNLAVRNLKLDVTMGCRAKVCGLLMLYIFCVSYALSTFPRSKSVVKFLSFFTTNLCICNTARWNYLEKFANVSQKLFIAFYILRLLYPQQCFRPCRNFSRFDLQWNGPLMTSVLAEQHIVLWTKDQLNWVRIWSNIIITVKSSYFTTEVGKNKQKIQRKN